METKRCTYCHKLQRASARTCSRCGRPFAETKKVTKPAGRYFSLPSIPSVPSASPHRAGHYSGLHPEDQPYQTNMINVQRAHEQKWEDGWRQLPRQEPEVIILPLNGISSDLEVKDELDARSPFKLVGQKSSRNRFKPPQLPRRLIPVLLTA